MAECTNCGRELPEGSRFCLECGTPVEAAKETVVEEVPAHEPEAAPVEPQVAERRFFGVPPSSALLMLGLAALVAAVVLFATGNWPWALILLGVSLFLLTGFVSQVRRLPSEASSSGLSKASLSAVGSVRARTSAAVETVAAHGSARVDLMRLRREVGALARERSVLLGELGEATYAGNRAATKHVKGELQVLDEKIQAKEEQMAQVTANAQERIEKARLNVQQTRVIGEEAPPDQAPEPAQVPEPFPPPDEGAPPQPAQVPEPFPPPDEGDRPQQPTIPEPGPGRSDST